MLSFLLDKNVHNVLLMLFESVVGYDIFQHLRHIVIRYENSTTYLYLNIYIFSYKSMYDFRK